MQPLGFDPMFVWLGHFVWVGSRHHKLTAGDVCGHVVVMRRRGSLGGGGRASMKTKEKIKRKRKKKVRRSHENLELVLFFSHANGNEIRKFSYEIIIKVAARVTETMNG